MKRLVIFFDGTGTYWGIKPRLHISKGKRRLTLQENLIILSFMWLRIWINWGEFKRHIPKKPRK